MNKEIRDKLISTGWFQTTGAYTLFDGQFGSTGKGLLASVLAEHMGDFINTVTTNAGPNSGHTAWYHKQPSVKIMTQQIPVASVVMSLNKQPHVCYLNGGAVIDADILREEVSKWVPEGVSFVVHPCASLIHKHHKGDCLSKIASTGKGVAPAIADKIMRVPYATVGEAKWDFVLECPPAEVRKLDPETFGVCFVETAQGFSLGINSGFYPYTTSRECSVSQALADLGVSPKSHCKSIVSLRAHPIRVGNTPDGYSGPCYDDQKELTWRQLGVEAELTTVTKRVRRVFSWSWQQYKHMLVVNRPDALFLNFLNYLGETEKDDFIVECIRVYVEVVGKSPDFVLLGNGPQNEDIKLCKLVQRT